METGMCKALPDTSNAVGSGAVFLEPVPGGWRCAVSCGGVMVRQVRPKPYHKARALFDRLYGMRSARLAAIRLAAMNIYQRMQE